RRRARWPADCSRTAAISCASASSAARRYLISSCTYYRRRIVQELQEQHLKNAATLVRAMMASASSEKIRRIEWWQRAKSALETAAMSADSFSSMVSAMARKLQIDVTTTTTGLDVANLALAVEPDFESFRRFCEREAIYVVA